VFGCGDRIWTC